MGKIERTFGITPAATPATTHAAPKHVGPMHPTVMEYKIERLTAVVEALLDAMEQCVVDPEIDFGPAHAGATQRKDTAEQQARAVLKAFK